MSAFCLASKASNTQRQYKNAFNLFCKFCLSFNITLALQPYTFTNCLKISGVIGFFLTTRHPTDLIEPSLIVLTRSDYVFIYDNHVKLFLESSKTDVYREGRDVLISMTNTPTCPVNMLLRYFYLARLIQIHDSHLFPGFFAEKDYMYFQVSKPPSS
jgi:hypothetical protein